tara:strand:- start:589 stop:858 length:270 start_codon:yes stop_codon:yes gene_type:complete
MWGMIQIGQPLRHKRNSAIKARIEKSCFINNIPHYYLRVSGDGQKTHSILLSESGIKLSYQFVENYQSNKSFSILSKKFSTLGKKLNML